MSEHRNLSLTLTKYQMSLPLLDQGGCHYNAPQFTCGLRVLTDIFSYTFYSASNHRLIFTALVIIHFTSLPIARWIVKEVYTKLPTSMTFSVICYSQLHINEIFSSIHEVLDIFFINTIIPLTFKSTSRPITTYV